jgi:hypothetical protein
VREGVTPHAHRGDEMKQLLICKACGARLTAPLMIQSGKDPSVPHPEHKDREPLTQEGVAFKSYGPIERSFGKVPTPLEFVPQIWVNPNDLTEVVRLTKNRSRLNGCCGLDGADGPNQLCNCGAEIGTLKTDCWTARVFVAEPGTTEWMEEK